MRNAVVIAEEVLREFVSTKGQFNHWGELYALGFEAGIQEVIAAIQKEAQQYESQSQQKAE